MPTREAQFLKQLDPATIPPNLIIRMSSHMINQGPVKLLAVDVDSHHLQASVRARPRTRATSAAAVEHAGTGPHQTCVTVNINVIFRHPKYYAELRKRRRKLTSSQASGDKRPSRRPRVQASSQSSQAQRSHDQGTSAQVPRSRVQATRINVFCGCFTWKLIWWGEKRILLPFVTFNSSVKKCSLTE